MNIEELSKIVSTKLGMSEHYVNEINRIQWKFLHKEIQSGDFKPVGIIYLGKFNLKDNIAKRRKEMNESN